MALTKSDSTLVASQSVSAGGSKASSSFDPGYEALVTATIANGGSAPSTACDVIVEVSADDTTFWEYARYSAGLDASTTYSFAILIPAAVSYAKVTFTGHTGQAVTVAAVAQIVTGI